MSFSVPVVDVSRANIADVQPSLMLAMRMASFIAVDLETSGIGGASHSHALDLQDRYTRLVEVTMQKY